MAHSRLYETNSGVFLSEGQAGLIDPCIFPDEIEAVARFLAGRRATPRFLILTHSHWDHILGPERFPGVEVVAQANYLAEVAGAGGDRIRREIAAWEGEYGLGRERPFAIPAPDQLFAETLVLSVGSLSLLLAHAPGHAADQLVVYHAESATLWASDILSDVEIPFISHSLAAYERTLAVLSTREIRVLVPGHGRPTTDPAEIRARLSGDLAYLAELRERVERVVRQGGAVEEAVAACAGMSFHHPEENAGPHRLNVESVYLELGGAADPAQVGWHRTTDAAGP